MLVVLGLGNPTSKYERTRHNVGVDTLEKLAASYQVKLKRRCFSSYKVAKIKLPDRDVLLVFPLTYMNRSGDVLKKVLKSDDELLVICDQLDLPIGKIRFRLGGSSAGHNGLKSIINNYNSEFIRLYIGIGRPKEGVSVPDHVLTLFDDCDRLLIDKAIEKSVDSLKKYIEKTLPFERVLQDANSYDARRDS